MKCKLWSINRWLRYTGVRLAVVIWDGQGERTPTQLELFWAGLPGSAGWKRWQGE